jgi:hypothetical protein
MHRIAFSGLEPARLITSQVAVRPRELGYPYSGARRRAKARVLSGLEKCQDSFSQLPPLGISVIELA